MQKQKMMIASYCDNCGEEKGIFEIDEIFDEVELCWTCDKHIRLQKQKECLHNKKLTDYKYVYGKYEFYFKCDKCDLERTQKINVSYNDKIDIGKLVLNYLKSREIK